MQPSRLNVLQWIRGLKSVNFHCRAVRQFGDLRNGIALRTMINAGFKVFEQADRSLSEDEQEDEIDAAGDLSDEECLTNLTSCITLLNAFISKQRMIPSTVTTPAFLKTISPETLLHDIPTLEKLSFFLYELSVSGTAPYVSDATAAAHNNSDQLINNEHLKDISLISSFQQSQPPPKRPPINPSTKKGLIGSPKSSSSNTASNVKKSSASAITAVTKDDDELFYASDLPELDQFENVESQNDCNGEDERQRSVILDSSNYSVLRPNSPYISSSSASAAQTIFNRGSRQNSFSSDTLEVLQLPPPSSQQRLAQQQLSSIQPSPTMRNTSTTMIATQPPLWGSAVKVEHLTPQRGDNNNNNNSSFESAANHLLKVSQLLNSSIKGQKVQHNIQQHHNLQQQPDRREEAKRMVSVSGSSQMNSMSMQYNCSTNDDINTSFLSRQDVIHSHDHLPPKPKAVPTAAAAAADQKVKVFQSPPLFTAVKKEGSANFPTPAAAIKEPPRKFKDDKEGGRAGGGNSGQQERRNSNKMDQRQPFAMTPSESSIHRSASVTSESSAPHLHPRSSGGNQVLSNASSSNKSLIIQRETSVRMNSNLPRSDVPRSEVPRKFDQRCSSKDSLKSEIQTLDELIAMEKQCQGKIIGDVPPLPFKYQYFSQATAVVSRSPLLGEEKKVTPSQPQCVITVCSESSIARSFAWLVDIGLLRKDVKDLKERLPQLCKNGLIFVDVINRLSARSEGGISGVDRHPKSQVQIKANYAKIFAFLRRSLPRLNTRYLFHAEVPLMKGDHDVFWGVLEDLWYYYHNKPSAACEEKVERKRSAETVTSRQTKKLREEEKQQSQEDYEDMLRKGSAQQQRASSGAAKTLSTVKSHHMKPDKLSYTESSSSMLVVPSQKSIAPSSVDHSASQMRTFTLATNMTTTVSPPRSPVSSNSRFRSISNQQASRENPATVVNTLSSYCDINDHRKKQQQHLQSGDSFILGTPGSRFRQSPSNRSFNSSRSRSRRSLKTNSSFVNTSFTNCASPLKNSSQKQQQRVSTPAGLRLPVLTLEMEMQTKEFLSLQGFSKFIVKRDKALFEDPLRSGKLLCELLMKLSASRRLEGYTPIPKTIDDCRDNLDVFFHALRQLPSLQSSIPKCLFQSAEDIIRGDHDATWTLLYFIMKSERIIMQSSRLLLEDDDNLLKECSSNNGDGGYNSEGEEAIYLPYNARDIQALEKSIAVWVSHLLMPDTSFSVNIFFAEVKQKISSGLWLCNLTSKILGRHIAPCHTAPATKQSRLANIRKAMNALRNNDQIGKKFLWSEAKIEEANSSIILALLEDLRIFSDGHPARRGEKYFSDTPYLGDPSILHRHEVKTMSSSLQQLSRDAATVNQKKVGQQPSSEGEFRKVSASSSRNSPMRHSNTSFSTTQTPFLTTISDVQERVSPIHMHLCKWLENLGLSTIAQSLNGVTSEIDSFKNGLFLCRIIEALENQKIPGIINDPRTQSSCLANIRKAFFVLRANPSFDESLARDEQQLLSGKRHYIISLLTAIKVAYKSTSSQKQSQPLHQAKRQIV